MSTYRSVVTSCSISAIGNSGARSSGPTGCSVPGCSTGGGGAGRSGITLYHWVGISDSARVILVGSPIALSSWQAPGRPHGSPHGWAISLDQRMRGEEAPDQLVGVGLRSTRPLVPGAGQGVELDRGTVAAPGVPGEGGARVHPLDRRPRRAAVDAGPALRGDRDAVGPVGGAVAAVRIGPVGGAVQRDDRDA